MCFPGNIKTDILPVIENPKNSALFGKNSAGEDVLNTMYEYNDSAKIRYNGIWADVDLEYILSGNNVKENLILNKYTEISSWKYKMETENLSAEFKDNKIVFADIKSGKVVFEMEPPYMYDADNNISHSVNYSLEKIGDEFFINVCVDTGWLKSPERKYPVIIDPPLRATTISKDSHVSRNNSNANYGSDTGLRIQNDANDECFALLKIIMPSIPSNATIRSSFLYVSFFSVYTYLTSMNVGIYGINYSWNESSVNWNTANVSGFCDSAHSDTGTLTCSTFAYYKARYINTTNIVKQWYAGRTNNGIAIKYESGTNKTLPIESKESADATMHPYYSVNYTVDDLIIENGTYFLKNKRTEKYVDIENSIMANGTKIHQWAFSGDDSQRWIFTYLHDGYYSIKSANSSSNYYLGVVNDSTATDAQIVLRTGSPTDGMKCSITTTASGAYTITPKTGEGSPRKVLAVGWYALNTNGIAIQQREYVNDNNYKDEWYMLKLEYTSEVALEGQKKSNWCWVATSRMFSKHFYSMVSYTQNQAVAHVKGSEINEGGTNAEIMSAINYLISGISSASLSLQSKTHNIYSESTLIKFLDDGYVVAVGRGWFTNINDSTSMSGAHETLIIGYAESNGKIWFIVHDPLPVNNGESYLMSYEKLVNGRNAQFWETTDRGVWIDCIVINTLYSNETIPYYFED